MEDRDVERRAEIARRLKAARWLAGRRAPNDARGKADWKVVALSPEDLAKRPPLPENGITASMLGSIERMERPTRPMELAAIAQALGLSVDWFVVPQPTDGFASSTQRLVSQLVAAVRDHERERAQPPPGENGQDRSGPASAGDR